MTAPIEAVDTTATEPANVEDTASGDAQPERKMPREQRYRLELREAERQRDALAVRVGAYQRADVLRLATGLAQPSDLLEFGGRELSEFIAEDGSVDAETVEVAVNALLEQRPGLALRPKVGATDPSQGLGGGRGKPTPSWEGFLKS